MSDYSARTYIIDKIPADIKQKIEQKIELDTYNFEYCSVFDSLEDYAIYEVDDGWYSGCVDLNVDYHGAPNLSYYIDYQALGTALSQTWDESRYAVLSDGRVVALS